MDPIAATPEPPYYAVLFTSLSTAVDAEGYAAMSAKMRELACEQPGYLGIESVRGDDGVGITVSYWKSLDAIRDWKQHAEHKVAQALGRSKWYERYSVRICRVEREDLFSAEKRGD